MSMNIGILIFDGAEELDYVGPWEVFTSAIMADPESTSKVFTVAERPEPIYSGKGMRVVPDHTFADVPPIDVIVVPGGMGTRQEQHNDVLIDWLRATGEKCTWVTSVCTGSLLLTRAGFTSGKRITTHWGFVDQLREIATDSTVSDNDRYIQDGNVVTAAGVSAGIDMSLWLVGQLWSEDHARTTQRYIQYEPEPPYAVSS